MTRDKFLSIIKNTEGDKALLEIARKHLLHGTPEVFAGNDGAYYDFRSMVSNQFGVRYEDVLIVGSAKLGYSYHKDSYFNIESDIDVAIVNEELFDQFQYQICLYQYDYEKGRVTPSNWELKQYRKFLQYMVKGWMRPDYLPVNVLQSRLKDDWFEYFKSISYGRSPVGNYKVSAGLFKNWHYIEKYYMETLKSIK